MTHARIPDFSSPLPAPQVSLRVIPRDPVLSAIEAHAEAWAAYWCAPAGRAAERAEDRLSAALEDLLSAPCGSNYGALALVRYLRGLIEREAIKAETADLCGRLVLVREADLTRFTGFDLLPEDLSVAQPCGWAPAAVTPSAPPALSGPLAVPALHRALAAAGLAGEALTALAIIAGGVLAYGFLPPL